MPMQGPARLLPYPCNATSPWPELSRQSSCGRSGHQERGGTGATGGHLGLRATSLPVSRDEVSILAGTQPRPPLRRRRLG
jgi:hypothetical protein